MFVYSIFTCFIYYIHSLLLYQMQRDGLVVSKLACNHWDLGSIPRSPKYCFYFFLTWLCAGYPKRSTIRLIQMHAMWL